MYIFIYLICLNHEKWVCIYHERMMLRRGGAGRGGLVHFLILNHERLGGRTPTKHEFTEASVSLDPTFLRIGGYIDSIFFSALTFLIRL